MEQSKSAEIWFINFSKCICARDCMSCMSRVRPMGVFMFMYIASIYRSICVFMQVYYVYL